MNTKKFNCSTCGALLEAPSKEFTFKCKYCNTINVVKGDKVIIKKYSEDAPIDKDEEFRIKFNNACYLLNKAQNYKDAFILFRELYHMDKTNKYVLEGVIRAADCDFNSDIAIETGFYVPYIDNPYIEMYNALEEDKDKVQRYKDRHKALLDDINGYETRYAPLYVFIAIVFVIMWFIGILG